MNKKRFSKMMSILLVMAMLFTMMPAVAWADEAEARNVSAVEESAGEQIAEDGAEPVIPADTKLISLQVAVGGATADSITEKTLKEVCDELQDKGVVKSSESMRHFMVEKGYDSFLHAGSFNVKKGMSEDEIGKIFSK